MIYINKNHNLFSVISHNSTNGKKVLGPLLASVIINNPLQKKPEVCFTAICRWLTYQVRWFLYSVINRTKSKPEKPLEKW